VLFRKSEAFSRRTQGRGWQGWRMLQGWLLGKEVYMREVCINSAGKN